MRVGFRAVRNWFSPRGGLWLLVVLVGVIAVAAAATFVTTARGQESGSGEVPLSDTRIRMLTAASAACPAVRPARLAGQVMATTGFEPTTAGGIGGLTEAEWATWKPAEDAVPADEAASLRALANLMCDLVGRLRADGPSGDLWRLAVAAFGSTLDDVRADGGVPAQASGFVTSVETFTAIYEKRLGDGPEPTPAPITAEPSDTTSATPTPSPTPLLSTTAPATTRAAAPTTVARQPLSFPLGPVGDVRGMKYNGSASLVNGRLDLVKSLGQAGSAWATTRLDTTLPVTTFFRAAIAGPSDGFAFLIQTQGPAALGGTAAGLGYGAVYTKDDPAIRIRPSVAIEFDTYDNSPEGWDPPGHPHVAVTADGDAKNHLVWADPGFPMSANQPFNVWITYNPSAHAMAVYVSQGDTRPAKPLLNYSIDLRAALGSDRAYVGFTGGTGEWASLTSVLAWSMN